MHPSPTQMATTRRRCRLGLLALLWFTPWNADAAADTQQVDAAAIPAAVSDLVYREVLFHYYQNQPFTALSHLMMAQQRDALGNNQAQAELLQGGLKLAYGMHQEASELFQRLLVEPISAEARDRAWYQLGRLLYRRGLLDQAYTALDKVGRDTEWGRQASLLQAQVLIRQDHPVEATRLLASWGGPAALEPYARYNLAMAQLLSGNARTGLKTLDGLGQQAAGSDETRALRDRANLTLGLQRLASGQPQQAREALDRISLNGPLASRALLAAGLADSRLDNDNDALLPWTELGARDPGDPAVQEGLLALPYAYTRLGDRPQAAQHYQLAIAAYQQARNALAAATREVEAGRLPAHANALSGRQAATDKPLTDAQAAADHTNRQLLELMAAQPFQEGLRNLRELDALQQNLDGWLDEIPVYQDMLATREQAYTEQLPRAADMLSGERARALHQAWQARAAHLEATAAGHNTVALASAREQQQWQRLQDIGERLQRLAAVAEPTTQRRALQHKHHLLQGLLIWQLDQAYSERLWQARKQQQQAGDALAQLEQQRDRVSRALEHAPAGFAGFDARIGSLQQRLISQRERLAQARRDQQQQLEQLALAELQRREDRLSHYQIQARFALAQLYDQGLGINPYTNNPDTNNSVKNKPDKNEEGKTLDDRETPP